jgi:hypothetical protein
VGSHEPARQAADIASDRRTAPHQIYAGIVDVPGYGIRGKRGDFAPLISEELFYRVQAILSGRVPSMAPLKRAPPDFPLRGFVRCDSCGRGLTDS